MVPNLLIKISRYAPFKDLFVLKRQLPALNLHISYLNSPCHENFTIVLTVGSCFDSPDDLVLLLKTWQSTRGCQLFCANYVINYFRLFINHGMEVCRSSEVPESDSMSKQYPVEQESRLFRKYQKYARNVLRGLLSKNHKFPTAARHQD
ncbi:hypothetical protein EV2_027205 [Malus domestica]